MCSFYVIFGLYFFLWTKRYQIIFNEAHNKDKDVSPTWQTIVYDAVKCVPSMMWHDKHCARWLSMPIIVPTSITCRFSFFFKPTEWTDLSSPIFHYDGVTPYYDRYPMQIRVTTIKYELCSRNPTPNQNPILNPNPNPKM